MRRVSVCIAVTLILLMASVPHSAVQAQDHDVETLGLLWENLDGHNATLWNIRWSPDGTMISGGFFDETVTIFDAKTGEIVHKITPYDGTSARSEETSSRCWGDKDSDIEDYWPIRVTAWSPDGSLLAVGGDKANVTIYHTSNWSMFKILDGYKGSVQSMEFSKDGELLATGTGTDKVDIHNMQVNEVWVWNTTTWVTETVLKGHMDAILDVRFSPNDTRLATASDDKSIRIWVRGTWEQEKLLLGHTLGVLDVAWSLDGKTLISGSRDYKINVWDYETEELTTRYSEANCVRSVDFHPTGDIFASSGVDEVQLKVRDTATGSVLKSFTEGMPSKSDIMSARWSPDGNYLAAAAGKEHALRVYAFGEATGNGGDGDEQARSIPGMVVFFIAIAVATVIAYYPLVRIRKEGGR